MAFLCFISAFVIDFHFVIKAYMYFVFINACFVHWDSYMYIEIEVYR